jgi:transcription-repair coupling factor (superfamily II helicase)
MKIDLNIRNIENFFDGEATSGVRNFKKFFAKDNKKKVLIACKSLGVLEGIKRLLEEGELQVAVLNHFIEGEKLNLKHIGLFIYEVAEGFETEDFYVIADEMIIGKQIASVKKKKELNLNKLKLTLNQFEKGDLVVHTDFGVGLFDGILTIETGGIKCDVVKIIYQNNDVLYIPVYNINQVKKYGNEVPEEERKDILDKLGGNSFKLRKAKAKSRIFAIAEKLMETAAKRKLLKAKKAEINEEEYDKFAKDFPFALTEDQEVAINDVITDITSGAPMDRLICGDVGFGKTEVAMRASFFASYIGQVAIVVPTTILARQHFNNFKDRFKNTHLKICELSRNVTSSEKEFIKLQVENGEIDILIGTHALFAENLKFNNLQLLIIDEEQHFGVKQKEKLKNGREGVHFLALSATPIPRTLQMSLSGLRDISIIQTPPFDRILPKTFLMPFDIIVIASAITREKARGGRVFFVCPRISDLETQKAKLEEALPEVRFAIAHGRMQTSKIEDTMLAFYEGGIDVLITTSIVESGIDISFANTIIIYKADMFGLSSAYQLRGRVGRGAVQSFAYLIVDESRMQEGSVARNRLLALANIKSLGAGFKIAGTDMDIRGAGNLVGEEQSGKISGVGIELYEEMLKEAVEKIKSGGVKLDDDEEDFTPEVKIGMPILIAEDYIPDFNLRLEFYRRISAVLSIEELNALNDEMIDRFGRLPEGTDNLINIIKIKIKCREIGILKFEVGERGVVIWLKEALFKSGEKLLSYAIKNPKLVKINPEGKVNFYFEGKNLLEKANKVLLILS